MKHLITSIFLIFLSDISYSQTIPDLVGKTFEYKDPYTNGVEKYVFISNTESKLIMLSSFGGQSYRDVCICKYTLEGNKVKVNCICEDKEVFPNPLREAFIYDFKNKTLTTTIHYDQNKKPRIFYLKP